MNNIENKKIKVITECTVIDKKIEYYDGSTETTCETIDKSDRYHSSGKHFSSTVERVIQTDGVTTLDQISSFHPVTPAESN